MTDTTLQWYYQEAFRWWVLKEPKVVPKPSTTTELCAVNGSKMR